LRRADAIVRRVSLETGVEALIWQFPVILIPFGTSAKPDSVVLRPVQSVDGMTANAYWMRPEASQALVEALRAMSDIAGVYYDLTHKPPGTIEWE
jgi:GMP synthase (glutamine-hydrolysing)